jgi:hypothetical protein
MGKSMGSLKVTLFSIEERVEPMQQQRRCAESQMLQSPEVHTVVSSGQSKSMMAPSRAGTRLKSFAHHF